jgi:hypothetical protein
MLRLVVDVRVTDVVAHLRGPVIDGLPVERKAGGPREQWRLAENK